MSNEILETSAYKAGAWNHFTDDGKKMSDHNGVYAVFL